MRNFCVLSPKAARISSGRPGESAALLAAFQRAFAPSPGGGIDASARIAFLADDAVVVADDVPYPLDRAAYADHLAFHAAAWQLVEWRWYETRLVRAGECAVVSAFYTLRGKPKGAGFRLRPGYCTAVCVATPAGWRALALHMSPLIGQMLDASPS